MGVKLRQKPVWYEREGESSKAYAAFCLYRDMGPERSVLKVAKARGSSAVHRRWLEEWSSKYEWVARAEAYDASIGNRSADETAKAMVALRHKLLDAATKGVDRALSMMDNLDEMDARWSEVSGLLRTSMDALERLSPSQSGAEGVGKVVRVPNNGRGEHG